MQFTAPLSLLVVAFLALIHADYVQAAPRPRPLLGILANTVKTVAEVADSAATASTALSKVAKVASAAGSIKK